MIKQIFLKRIIKKSSTDVERRRVTLLLKRGKSQNNENEISGLDLITNDEADSDQSTGQNKLIQEKKRYNLLPEYRAAYLLCQELFGTNIADLYIKRRENKNQVEEDKLLAIEGINN